MFAMAAKWLREVQKKKFHVPIFVAHNSNSTNPTLEHANETVITSLSERRPLRAKVAIDIDKLADEP